MIQRNKIYLVLILFIICVPLQVTAKEKELPYTYKNPHIYVVHGATNIEWRNNTWGVYVLFKYVGTKTPLGIIYKRVPLWYKYLAPINVRLRYKEIGQRYVIERVH